MRIARAGLTLTEVLVVICIIGLLAAILLPAVQAARESARRTACQNNLRQIGLAQQSYESAHRALPSMYNGSFLAQARPIDEFHFHSWRSASLQELEQTAIFGLLDFKLPATDATQQLAVNSAIPTFVCPSTPNVNALVRDVYGFSPAAFPGSIVGTAARSDYEVIGGVSSRPSGTLDLANIGFGAWGEPRYDTKPGTEIVTASYRKARFGDVVDGLSSTLLIGERAGRPDLYKSGEPVDPFPYRYPERGMDHHQAAWAISTHFWWTVFWHEQKVNDTNATGIFSFHTDGANVALADGSVRFLSESTSTRLLNALATRAGNENADLP